MILLIIVLEVLAILANLALPISQDATLHARATAIARDMEMVRRVSIQARAGHDSWSPAPVPDAAPPEVTAALPSGFAFEQKDCRLVWEHWSVSDPASLGLRQSEIGGVTVVAADPRLAALVAAEIPRGEIRFTNGNRTTLVVDP